MLRKCKDCGREAHTDEDLKHFVQNKTMSYNKANLCNPCNLNRSTALRQKDPDNRKKYDKTYRQKHRDKCLERQRKWGKENRDIRNAGTARYRAAKLNATPPWADHESIQKLYRKAHYHRMEVDHIVPLQSDLVCGLHTEHNLQLLSKEDNISKLNRKWPEQW